jgi:hypothetical protein
MVLIHAARASFVFGGEVRSKTHNLSHHPACTHDPRASERHVRGADITAGHEQVLDVFGIKAAVWNRVGRHFNVPGTCEKLLTLKIFAVFGIGEMQVDGPGSGNRAVGIKLALLDVHLI